MTSIRIKDGVKLVYLANSFVKDFKQYLPENIKKDTIPNIFKTGNPYKIHDFLQVFYNYKMYNKSEKEKNYFLNKYLGIFIIYQSYS